jgi:catechol 2,3-dioxygenase-like lactoylglutathione lyase family enzyme
MSPELLTRAEFFVSDPDRSRAFYERLGFSVLRSGWGYTLLDRGGARLGLQDDAYARDHDHYFTPHLDRFPRGVGVEVSVDVPDRQALQALYATAQEMACVVRELVDRPWGATDFRVADPDGYFVRFTTPLAAAGE